MAKKVLKGGLVHIIRDQIGSPAQEPYHKGVCVPALHSGATGEGKTILYQGLVRGGSKIKAGSKRRTMYWGSIISSFPVAPRPRDSSRYIYHFRFGTV